MQTIFLVPGMRKGREKHRYDRVVPDLPDNFFVLRGTNADDFFPGYRGNQPGGEIGICRIPVLEQELLQIIE